MAQLSQFDGYKLQNGASYQTHRHTRQFVAFSVSRFSTAFFVQLSRNSTHSTLLPHSVVSAPLTNCLRVIKGFPVGMLIFALLNVIATALMATAAAQAAQIDDLIVARCQSTCLLELEQRHLNGTEARRHLRHHITAMCAEDVICASCILPCRAETTPKRADCVKHVCREATEVERCEESCALLERIHYNKPGACPPMSSVSTLECSASCDADGDCAETQKCCVSGCSRVCRVPTLSDERLLPVPDGITVHERKRKRSAIVRWIMKRMAPAHVATSTNVFVVQWRWSVHQHDDTMTPWQTITMRNKMYAILKHVLAPGRFYSFRVAAVNAHGSYGYSRPSSPPFKLSRTVKAPSAPSNLSLVAMYVDERTGQWVPTISWQAPRSDLPLKDYQLSWWKMPNSTVGAVRLAKRRLHHRSADETSSTLKRRRSGGDALHDDDAGFDYEADDGADAIELLPSSDAAKSSKNVTGTRRRVGYGISGGAAHRVDLRTTLLPSYSNSAELRPFTAGQDYVVELYASIESSDGELRGEPAVMHIPANIEKRFAAATTTVKYDGVDHKLVGAPIAEITARMLWQPVTEDKGFEVGSNRDAAPLVAASALLRDAISDNMRLVDEPATRFFGVGIDATTSTAHAAASGVDWNEHHGVELKTPYVERDGLKTALSWLHHPACPSNLSDSTSSPPSARFRVRIRSNGDCINELPPQEFRINFCVANFENLQFECQYFVEVVVIDSGRTITKMKFTTAPCAKTPSVTKIKCLPRPRRPDIATTQLTSDTLSVTTITTTSLSDATSHASISTITTTAASSAVVVVCAPLSALAAECNWRPNAAIVGASALVGYRIILDVENSTENIVNGVEEDVSARKAQLRTFVSVVGATERRVHLQSLIPATHYRFRVQPLTVHGLGVELFQTRFHTPALSIVEKAVSNATSPAPTTSQSMQVVQTRRSSASTRRRQQPSSDNAFAVDKNISVVDALSLFNQRSSSPTVPVLSHFIFIILSMLIINSKII